MNVGVTTILALVIGFCGHLLTSTAEAKAETEAEQLTKGIFPAKGHGSPSWYEANRVQFHTRLGPYAIARGAELPDWYEAVFQQAAGSLRDLGVEVLTRHIRSQTEPVPFSPPAPTYELVQAVQQETKRFNDKTIAYFWHSGSQAIAKTRPEEHCRNPLGDPINHPRRGPYLDFTASFGETVGEWFQRLEADGYAGVYLDGRHFPPQGCFGTALEADFAEALGNQRLTSLDKRLRDFKIFQGQQLANVALSWGQSLKTDEFAYIVSVATLPALINGETRVDLARTGIPKTEHTTAFRPGTNLRLFQTFPNLQTTKPTHEMRRAAGLSLLRSVSSSSPHVWLHNGQSRADWVQNVGQTITHGGIANVDLPEAVIAEALGLTATPPKSDGFDTALLGDFVALNTLVSSNFTSANFPKYAAVLFDEKGRDARKLNEAWTQSVGPTSLAFAHLLESGLPADLIDEKLLTTDTLADYKVLIAPESFAFSPDQERVLHQAGVAVTRLPRVDDQAAVAALKVQLNKHLGDTPFAGPRLLFNSALIEARLWRNDKDGQYFVSAVKSQLSDDPVEFQVQLSLAGSSRFCTANGMTNMGREDSDTSVTLTLSDIWTIYPLTVCPNRDATNGE